MTTFAVTSVDDVLTAVNFAISNLNTTPVSLANSVLTVDQQTNAVTVGVGGQIYAYNVQFINIRYANNATGTSGFTTSPTNAYYYGIQATAEPTPPTLNNPASYSWNQVAGAGFGTTEFLFYQTPGGRQITFDIAPAAVNGSFIQVADGQAIDLDLISTIAANVVISNTIANGAVTGSQIAANTITSFNIQTNTIQDTDIAPGTITGTRIASNTITSTNIAPLTIVASRIANATITNQQIAANTILGTNIQAATITGSRIATNTISGTNIGLETITGNNIANGTIQGSELASDINISTTGNISAAFLAGDGSQISNISAGNITGAYGNANVANFLNNFGSNNIVTTGNISASFYSGNGSQLTGIVSSYGNANVVTLLAGFGSNTISTTGNISAGFYAGNGSLLTGIVSSYGNANVATFMANFGSNTISTTGNISAATATIDQAILTATTFASLTASVGARAFITDANLVAANNFGQQVSGGASNTVPVWSDGSNWYIG